jgi:hypothetical protein
MMRYLLLGGETGHYQTPPRIRPCAGADRLVLGASNRTRTSELPGVMQTPFVQRQRPCARTAALQDSE